MAQKQASFNIAKRKGELGETIFREYLEKRGWIVYFPFTKDRPHYFDMLATKNKDKVIACDVKTKARLNFKPATGINIKAYKEYKNFMERAKIPFYLIFVDDKTGDVYLLDIAKTGEGEILKNGHIMIWEIKKMQYLFNIGNHNIKQLSQYDQRNYHFEPSIEEVIV